MNAAEIKAWDSMSDRDREVVFKQCSKLLPGYQKSLKLHSPPRNDDDKRIVADAKSMILFFKETIANYYAQNENEINAKTLLAFTEAMRAINGISNSNLKSKQRRVKCHIYF